MKKYWNLISDEADKLFEVGIVNNDNDVLLTAARIRGAFLLASTEPVEEVLPPVRPLDNKKQRKAPRRSPVSMTPEALEAIWAKTCPTCGAKPGEACVSIRSTSNRRIGERVNNVHQERGPGSRSIPNNPPVREDFPNPPVAMITPAAFATG